MTNKPNSWKLTLLDMGGTTVSMGVFYAFDLLTLKVSLIAIGSMGVYFALRRHVVGH
jgi:hypothetical protein